MKKWIRPIAALLSALTLCAGLHAAPQDRSRVLRPPSNGFPTMTLRPLCTTGPAPQVQTKVQNVYVQLAWAPVPGATRYEVGRSVPARTGTGMNLTPDPFTATEYWDPVPDIREAYQYTVTAVQPDGCMGTTSVSVSGPFPTPNPLGGYGQHPKPTQAVLTWPEQFGAIGYRIDGPNLPNTGFYVKSITLPRPGTKPPMFGTPRQVGVETQYEHTETLTSLGVPAGTYQIFALYPNAADYTRPGQIFVPRVQPIITGISPTSGTLGQTVVTISGQYLSDPSDGREPLISFGVSPNGRSAAQPGTFVTPKGVWPTAVTAVADASGYVQVTTYQRNPSGGSSPTGYAVSPTTFAGANAPPVQSAPPQVLVPGVVGLSLTGAIQVLQRDGFVFAGGSGPAGPGAIVLKQSPQGGAKAPAGSAVSVTTVAQPGGFSELTLFNNTAQQRTVNVWMLDQATGAWSGGSSVGYGASTTLNLSSARVYFVLAVDPGKCGGQNNPQNAACELWRLPGVPGDEQGPATTVAIN